MPATYQLDSAKSHNQHFSLQKYYLLQSQHEALCDRLDQIRSSVSTATASAATSPAVSPARCPRSRRHHARSSRRSSMPIGAYSGVRFDLETIVDEASLMQIAEEERRLFDVNEGIKRALTELLNCDNVRTDRNFRTWVQCRLMETEKELRSGRRRRSTAGFE